MRFVCLLAKQQRVSISFLDRQEAQLSQRDRATRYVSSNLVTATKMYENSRFKRLALST